MKVIVYEHVSGGGYAGQPIPQGVLCEGFGMLRCFSADLKAAGHEVTVLMDARISKLNPPLEVDCTVPIFYAHETRKFLNNITKINEAIYVIAPETGQTLQLMVQLAEKTGKTSLNCKSEAIAKVADKVSLHETLHRLGVTPNTLVLNTDDDLTKTKQTIKSQLSYPFVIKPSDGVSCSGLSLVKDDSYVEKAIAKIKAESTSKHYIAQEFINGQASSVSLLCSSKKAMAFCLNRQNVKITGPDTASSYEGGCVPFDHWLKQDALKVAEKVAEAFPGLRGYVGVDFVLTEHKAFVVDVNPRLTTSYIGLRKVAGFNVADTLISTIMEDKLPDKPDFRRIACFSKIETPAPTISAFS